jgi:hypothetical protein
VVSYITSQASHGVIPSFYAQAVAIAAYEMGFGKAAASIIEPTKQSRKVLRRSSPPKAQLHHGRRLLCFIDCTPYIEAGGLGDSGVDDSG